MVLGVVCEFHPQYQGGYEVHQWLEKQSVVYSDKRMLFILKKEGNLTPPVVWMRLMDLHEVSQALKDKGTVSICVDTKSNQSHS